MGQVQPAQIAPQQPQQVDDVTGPVALLGRRPSAPGGEQRQQPLLPFNFGVLRVEQPQDRPADQPLLRLAHVVLRLRLDERLFNQKSRLATADLVSNYLDQSIGHVLEHH